ncbi:DUF1700 domain-containing protein [Actinokineospora globicatena]|uniref:Proline-rich protein n=1 Tax=Actinokineospora globicatena TaxID=103729 RepID=A0A9W6QTZ3_9PSEU|nr:hypothetical protein [Actinokineospora globicatena]GLW94554.1 hypothetical protein Aglo03_53700 [Actinokineospora globicatena]
MNAETETRPGLADYLDRVRRALADLPADEVTEVMEDVEPHVTEVFAEAGDADEVTRRLGTPEAYAAELRAAGGYPPPEPAPGRARWAARYTLWITLVVAVVAFGTGTIALSGVNGQFAALGVFAIFALPALLWLFSGKVRPADVEGLAEYRYAQRKGSALVDRLPSKVVDYLRSLRPAWWLVRVLLVVLAIAIGSTETAIVLLVVVALVSWAEPRSRSDRRLVPVVVAANACLAGVVVVGLLTVLFSSGGPSPRQASYNDVSGLYYDGNYVQNVYAVDAQGKAIPEFYLYDEDGSPIKLYSRACYDSRDNEPDYDNKFPLPHVEYRGGTCLVEPGLPFVPLPPGATKSVAPSASGSAPTTAAPSTTGSAPVSTAESAPVSTTGSAPASTTAPTSTPGS